VTEPAPLPKPGDLIDGKYRVDHRIGCGAMSVVYQVTHRLTEKRFALKWLLPELAAEDDFAQRFLREAQVAGRFEHPNVVEVYDVGSSNGGFYMVLELLIGESLDQRISRVDEIAWADSCRLLLPCMRAVAEAHEHGIVHRDLKPGNIFVCKATKSAPEHTKVLDFGLAKLARLPGEPTLTGTRSGVVMGTPNYMPLEQMRGEAIDHRVDIFALGVTLYQTLSGRLPYSAATLADLVLVMATEPPAPLARWARTMPEAVGPIIDRALGRDPEDRYPDMHAFLEALAPFVPPGIEVMPRTKAGKVVPATPTGPVRPSGPARPSGPVRPSGPARPSGPVRPSGAAAARRGAAPRRHWLLPASLAIGLGLIAGFGAWLYRSAHHENARKDANHASTRQTAPAPTPPPASPTGTEALDDTPLVGETAPAADGVPTEITLPELVITQSPHDSASSTAENSRATDPPTQLAPASAAAAPPAPAQPSIPPERGPSEQPTPARPAPAQPTPSTAGPARDDPQQRSQRRPAAPNPPPEPRVDVPAPPDSKPTQPTPRPLSPTRLRPMNKDEF
jgi:serine/threonine protein kinase